jgi:hypothetical protein
VHYSEVEREVDRLVASAAPEDRLAFARHAVAELTRRPGLDAAVEAGFAPDAARAFREVLRDAVALDAPTLGERIEVIDAGDLSDGDMDSDALWALTALESWQRFQAGDETAVRTLALTLIEVVDFEVDGAALDDFLADPRMQELFASISDLLTGSA